MITEKHFSTAAKKLGCDIESIRAVDMVESGAIGFYPSGKVVLKFEGHVFREYTKGKFDKTHPHLSYKSWTEKYSVLGEKAYDRFNEAFNLDPVAAMLSSSWGRYQLMGENYKECGFKSIHEFVTAMKLGEDKQLSAFCNYIIQRKMQKYICNLPELADDFAYRYNGPLYKRNDYGGKLRQAYTYFKILYKKIR